MHLIKSCFNSKMTFHTFSFVLCRHLFITEKSLCILNLNIQIVLVLRGRIHFFLTLYIFETQMLLMSMREHFKKKVGTRIHI